MTANAAATPWPTARPTRTRIFLQPLPTKEEAASFHLPKVAGGHPSG